MLLVQNHPSSRRAWQVRLSPLFLSGAVGLLLAQPYESSLIYGLFQTTDYIRALRRTAKPDSTDDDVRKIIQLRQERYARLIGDNPPSVHVILDEAALRRAIGGWSAMNEQLEHLKSVAQLPTVALQIVPFEAGEYAALSAPFNLLRLPDEPRSEVVCIENDKVAAYLNRSKEIARYREMFDQASKCALDPADSITYLDRVKTPLRG